MGCLHQGHEKINEFVTVNQGNMFDPYQLERSWYRPKLVHSRLSKIVGFAAAASLGTAEEILLCMITALGFQGVLPNEAILQVMSTKIDQIQSHGWELVADFYRGLLDFAATGQQDIHHRFASARVFETMEFLRVVLEPYESYNHGIESPDGLFLAMGKLFGLLMRAFSGTLKSLSPL